MQLKVVEMKKYKKYLVDVQKILNSVWEWFSRDK